ncbi:hypothetical protein [Streptomyces sp. NPDC001876]|uniref:hypothetical protein n=1 Tax=Streptomyces sp. NPDC001876 TaxID=3154402 RepID=UPI0033178F17
MSELTEAPERWAGLWQTAAPTARWVIWNTDGTSMVFDRELNMPAEVADSDLREVLRRMRAAGAPEDDEYPGRACA